MRVWLRSRPLSSTSPARWATLGTVVTSNRSPQCLAHRAAATVTAHQIIRFDDLRRAATGRRDPCRHTGKDTQPVALGCLTGVGVSSTVHDHVAIRRPPCKTLGWKKSIEVFDKLIAEHCVAMTD
jgi:hypothetical protein